MRRRFEQRSPQFSRNRLSHRKTGVRQRDDERRKWIFHPETSSRNLIRPVLAAASASGITAEHPASRNRIPTTVSVQPESTMSSTSRHGPCSTECTSNESHTFAICSGEVVIVFCGGLGFTLRTDSTANKSNRFPSRFAKSTSGESGRVLGTQVSHS